MGVGGETKKKSKQKDWNNCTQYCVQRLNSIVLPPLKSLRAKNAHCIIADVKSDTTFATLRATISSKFRGWRHLIKTIARIIECNVASCSQSLTSFLLFKYTETISRTIGNLATRARTSMRTLQNNILNYRIQ